MRRYYKKKYQPQQRKQHVKKPFQPIQQPEWDDTIHDLSQLKLSPEEQLRRRLSRISKNQLGVALLDRRNRLSGSGSARYTPSHSSDSSDESSNENEPNHPNSEVRQQQWPGHQDSPGSDSEDDMCQWQGGAASPPTQQQRPVLGDIGNCSRNRGSKHQQHESKHSGTARQEEATGSVSKPKDGHISVPTETLQALFDKVDSLEQQLKLQQHHQAIPQQDQQDPQLQQQLANSQHQLSETQQQLAKLQEEHRQYVSHTSSLLTRLQAQLQQLMSHTPGLVMPGLTDSFARQHHGPDASASSSGQPTAALPPAVEPHWKQQVSQSSMLEALAPPAVSSSTRSSSGVSAQGIKQHLRAATAVATTASPRKSATGLGSGTASQGPGAAAIPAAGAGPWGRSVTATAAAAADAVALPSYAAMRQRASVSKGAGMGFAPCNAGLSDAATAGMASTLTTAPGRAGDATGSTNGPCAAGSCNAFTQMPHSLQVPDQLRPSSGGNELFSRLIPPPLPAYGPAAAAATALSGAPQQQQSRLAPGSWSNAAQVATVVCEHDQDAPAAMLNPSLKAESGLPGFRDADWGLQQGLPRAAVSRVFTDAGRFEGVEMPKPRVLIEQLKGSMSLSDHLRAAKSASGAYSGVRAVGS